MQTFLLAQDLGLPPLAPDLEGEGALHGAYAGANDLFQVDAPFRCPESVSAAQLPLGWRAQHVSLTPNTAAGLWKAHPEPGFASELLPQVVDCSVVFLAKEFWPHSMERVRPQLRASFQRHSLTGMRLRSQLRYNRAAFNIAIHARLGDIRPTPIDYQVATLSMVLQRLDPLGTLPVEVWVFSEAPEELNAPLRAARPLLPIHYDTANMSALLTLVHLMESDVAIGSDSSFSWFAAYLAEEEGGNPLFFTAPNARESPEFQNFMAGNVRVSPGPIFDDQGRLAALARQWRVTRPEALQPCTSNPFWLSVAGKDRKAAQERRLGYIANYKGSLQGQLEAKGHRAFDIGPPGPPLQCAKPLERFGGRLEGFMAGSGDGGKWLCGAREVLGGGNNCTIFSLGSNGDFSFEELMVEVTSCHVHSFDCTVDSPAEVGSSGRVHFHQVCIDSKDSEDGRMKTLGTLTRELGLASVQLLKMDIEGFELKVLDGFLRSFKADPAFSATLPGQISLELHHTDMPWLVTGTQIPMAALGGAFLALAEMGYAHVSREDNPSCPHCSEFTYVRIAC